MPSTSSHCTAAGERGAWQSGRPYAAASHAHTLAAPPLDWSAGGRRRSAEGGEGRGGEGRGGGGRGGEGGGGEGRGGEGRGGEGRGGEGGEGGGGESLVLFLQW